MDAPDLATRARARFVERGRAAQRIAGEDEPSRQSEDGRDSSSRIVLRGRVPREARPLPLLRAPRRPRQRYRRGRTAAPEHPRSHRARGHARSRTSVRARRRARVVALPAQSTAARHGLGEHGAFARSARAARRRVSAAQARARARHAQRARQTNSRQHAASAAARRRAQAEEDRLHAADQRMARTGRARRVRQAQLGAQGVRGDVLERERIVVMRGRADLAAIALIALSLIRIAATFTIYSATVDEPMHVSAALQLYTQHDYTYQPVNPPLPRLVFGLAPWIGGMQFDPKNTMEDQLLHVFHSNHRYKTNLVLARSGNLLFFVIAAIAVWWWARRELGANGGLVAVALFALQPVVAGYAGLVTHDISATAGVAVSLLAFARWLDVPSARHAMVFGAAFAFAVLCQFSDIGYVPAACLAMYLVRASRDAQTRGAWRHIAPSFGTALATCVVLIWAGYGFKTHWFFAGIHDLIWFDRMDFFGYAFG